MNAFAPKQAAAPLHQSDGSHLPRLQLELALEMADFNDSSLTDKFAQAAEAAGGDLLFVLPAPDGQGLSAMVRISSEGRDRYLQIKMAETGLIVAEETGTDANFLQLARSSVDVLRRIGTDRQVREPLSMAS